MLLSNRIDRKARLLLAVLIFASLLLLIPAHSVFAAAPSPIAGQPNKSCQEVSGSPGNASSAPGSAFNGTGVAGMVYAGTQPQNSNNPMSVSQYDVACYQVTIH